jgi:hypothetical protein
MKAKSESYASELVAALLLAQPGQRHHHHKTPDGGDTTTTKLQAAMFRRKGVETRYQLVGPDARLEATQAALDLYTNKNPHSLRG